jgi:hypothetical protein
MCQKGSVHDARNPLILIAADGVLRLCKNHNFSSHLLLSRQKRWRGSRANKGPPSCLDFVYLRASRSSWTGLPGSSE